MYRSDGLDANTNSGIYYGRSTDGGDTWEQSDGTAYTLPITEATAERAYTITEGSGLQNQCALGVDANGYPHAVHWHYDNSGNNQLFDTYQNASGWHHQQLTHFTVHWDWSGSSPSPPATYPMIVRDGSGSDCPLSPNRSVPRRDSRHVDSGDTQ